MRFFDTGKRETVFQGLNRGGGASIYKIKINSNVAFK